MNQIYQLLQFIYGEETAQSIQPRLEQCIQYYQQQLDPIQKPHYFDHQDAILITYGDMVQTKEQRPLQTLYHFLDKHVDNIISGIHLLPFYPATSDDGFSVVDYLQVDSQLGEWRDIQAFNQRFRLMVDAVINHISQKSDWYQAYLRGEAPYTNYFIEVAPDTDLTAVFRPRALPLLTPALTKNGTKYVWTTFSADQIDLNYTSPDLLLDILDTLLRYATYGAERLRLDAIAYMWKEIGTTCIHRPQTHALIQLIRAVFNEVAPQVALITETNVPHKENISYFGNGHNEAQMVYNFSLPPLVLHTMHTGNATTLSQWAATLDQPSEQTTFFNFLASHDGIGVTPARGLLSEKAMATMARRVQQLGGHVSYKNNSDGSKSAYELNINYLDALGIPNHEEENQTIAQRFLVTQAIMLALRGVPGIYFHSLFGSRSWAEGVQQTGRARTINRQKLFLDELEAQLNDPAHLRHTIFNGYRQLLQARANTRAFHPHGWQHIHHLHPAIFAVQRTAIDGAQSVLCLHNVSNQALTIALPMQPSKDLLSGTAYTGKSKISIRPYQSVWLS